jgi:hypothetical protein
MAIAGRDRDGALTSVKGVIAFDETFKAAVESRTHFRLTFSHTTGLWAYANCCISCGVLQGDFFLHHEPDGPFFALHASDSPCAITDLVGPARVATEDDPYADLS